MNIEEFITKAIEGGWKYRGRDNIKIDVLGGGENSVLQRQPCTLMPRIIATFSDGYLMNVNVEVILLDPLAWQAVGKVKKWGEVCGECGTNRELENYPDCARHYCDWQLEYRYRMHRFIDALCDSQDLPTALLTASE